MGFQDFLAWIIQKKIRKGIQKIYSEVAETYELVNQKSMEELLSMSRVDHCNKLGGIAAIHEAVK